MTAVPTEALTADELVKIARKQIDAFNNGDWEQHASIARLRLPLRRVWNRAQDRGPEKIVELFKGWKTAFPDAAGTVTSSVASGDKAALEVTWKGTHTGPLATAEGTIPASGKRQETPAAIFFAFEGDEDQGEPALLRLDDAAQADRRAAQVAAAARTIGGRLPRAVVRSVSVWSRPIETSPRPDRVPSRVLPAGKPASEVLARRRHR